jgi:hypothetical protein
MMWAKMNWDVGLVKFCPDEGFPDTRNLTYQDAHVEIQVAAFIEDKDPPPQTADGGFDTPTPKVTWDDQGNNVLTVDWKVADQNKPVVGVSHIGVGFQVDTLGKNSMDCAPKILHASLTGVTCESLGMTTPHDTAMPVITPGWAPYNSALVRFAHENASVTGAISFYNIDFYKCSAEPALSDLTAVNFPSLAKTWLSRESDFVLQPGESRDIIVPDVDSPEWLLSYYETDCLDTAFLVPGSVYTEAHVWTAGQMVPEPGVMSLLALGGLALLRRKSGYGG